MGQEERSVTERHSRRKWLRDASAAAGYTILAPAIAGAATMGIPGPFPGRVVAVAHSGVISGATVQSAAVRQIFQMGLLRLTEARSVNDAWAQFVSPADVVGIKINSSNGPAPLSSPQVFNEVVQELYAAGVPLSNIVIFDRYQYYFDSLQMGSWIPAGVSLAFASYICDRLQQDINGYDPDYYVDLPYVPLGQGLENDTARRSYIAQFATKRVTKIINLAVLKDHNAAGVTLALKNISYGLANNVNRGHEVVTNPHYDVFIPAIVSSTPIRAKVVLNIVDGIRGTYTGGPGSPSSGMWDNKTMYFATDPVAVDRVCWKAIDAKRASVGFPPADTPGPGEDPQLVRQPSYILSAGAAGLGESDDTRIDLRRYQYGLMR